jgi:cyclophilin family peptidyl-prolyl cis-trans isomerase
MMKEPAPRLALLLAGILCAGALQSSLRADTVVQLNLYPTAVGTPNNIQIHLYDNNAPITVQNFLKYVTHGDYNGTIIHRDAYNQDGSKFVIQGGGYMPVIQNNTVTGFSHIATYGTILNEFSSDRSNVYGTIAMAKLGGDPDSATSEWFINMNNNSALDLPANGSFTVFGNIINASGTGGMNLANTIANDGPYNLSNYGSAFGEMPLYTDGTNYSLIGISTAVVMPADWRGGSGTSWDTATNWDLGVTPGGAGGKIKFGNQSGNSVVNMSTTGRTTGSITFGATTNTTIQSTGGFSLTLDNIGGLSTVDVAGSHTISAPVVINNDVTFSGTGSGAKSLNLSGGVSGMHIIKATGGLNLTAKKIRADTLILDGATLTMLPSGTGGGAAAGASSEVNAVPEPSSLVLLGTAAAGLFAYTWRRWNRRAKAC